MAVTEGLDYVPLDGRLGSAAMEASSEKGVTPQGVRAGDPAALQALVDRRGPAVIAFCTQVCGPQAADRAAAEAFARFRAAVRDAQDLKSLDPEGLLRGATRHAAASMARQPSGPPPHGKLRSRGTETCVHVPTMLAARANGALGPADLERIARHLDRCERCNALAEIFRRAELAYQDPSVDTLGTDTSSVLLEALRAVPEHGHEVAPAPAGAPAGPTLDGAFPHLPDLDDEVPIAVAVPTPVEEEPEQEEFEPEAEQDAVAEAEDELTADEDLGETTEWDHELPDATLGPEPVEPVTEAPLLTGGHTRRGPSPRPLVLLLPLLLVLALAAGAAALAGFFDGDDGAATISETLAPRVQAPVTTPLPIRLKVAKPATPATTASSATPATTGTATADGTTGTDETTTGTATSSP
ncbi:MAG TPA: zf-HC2 domain-containing protein [Baekduia sp.]|nr:zf-HC2 domain-containing protein [Baekduia sp.]